jgi:hypothetical protein
MAIFPALVPSEAPITPGAWAVSVTPSLNGAEARIRHGSAQIGARWRPRFVNITEADYLAIKNHYIGQRSGFDSFGFDTVTLASDRTPSGYAWLYASPPRVVDDHPEVFTVECEFRCEPRGLSAVPGARWRTQATTFTPGIRDSGQEAAARIAAIEAADGTALESGVKTATFAYVAALKTAGIWAKTKQLLLPCGPRTLSGALVPLAGPSPTNNGYVSGDYSRANGLGDASNGSKYLNSNIAMNTISQTSNGIFAYGSVPNSSGELALGGWYGGSSAKIFLLDEWSNSYIGGRSFRSGTNTPSAVPSITTAATATCVIGSRTSASNAFIAIDTASATSAASVAADFSSSQTAYYYAINSEGSAAGYARSVLQAMGIFAGLTSQEATDLRLATADYVAAVAAAI